jgi:hypothetical protein
MQGVKKGKLVKVQRCPATVTRLVEPDNLPFMSQTTSWKGKLGTGIKAFSADLNRPPSRAVCG